MGNITQNIVKIIIVLYNTSIFVTTYQNLISSKQNSYLITGHLNLGWTWNVFTMNDTRCTTLFLVNCVTYSQITHWRKKKVTRNCWMKYLLKKRSKLSVYHNILQELRLHDLIGVSCFICFKTVHEQVNVFNDLSTFSQNLYLIE